MFLCMKNISLLGPLDKKLGATEILKSLCKLFLRHPVLRVRVGIMSEAVTMKKNKQ